MFRNLRADILRFSDDGKMSTRVLFRGLISQGFQAIVVYRFFRWINRYHIPGQPFRFVFERIVEITTGISVPVKCKIGKGLRIHHFGGIIFHPDTEIGENCTIYQGVTIGDKGGYGGAARVGNNVMIGAGAKLIGGIKVGSNSKIGANAVVSRDVPTNSVVYGNPSVIKPLKSPVNSWDSEDNEGVVVL